MFKSTCIVHSVWAVNGQKPDTDPGQSSPACSSNTFTCLHSHGHATKPPAPPQAHGAAVELSALQTNWEADKYAGLRRVRNKTNRALDISKNKTREAAGCNQKNCTTMSAKQFSLYFKVFWIHKHLNQEWWTPENPQPFSQQTPKWTPQEAVGVTTRLWRTVYEHHWRYFSWGCPHVSIRLHAVEALLVFPCGGNRKLLAAWMWCFRQQQLMLQLSLRLKHDGSEQHLTGSYTTWLRVKNRRPAAERNLCGMFPSKGWFTSWCHIQRNALTCLAHRHTGRAEWKEMATGCDFRGNDDKWSDEWSNRTPPITALLHLHTVSAHVGHGSFRLRALIFYKP